MQRRTYLAGAVVAAVTLSGCGGLIRPDPQIVDTEFEQSIEDAFDGTAQITVELVNDGRSGDIELTIAFEDETGAELTSESHEIQLDSDEEREETFTVELPAEMDTYRVDADPA